MPLPKEVLDAVASDIARANSALAELKEVVADMKLSGMDTTTQSLEVADLSKKLRSMQTFYELRKAKA